MAVCLALQRQADPKNLLACEPASLKQPASGSVREILSEFTGVEKDRVRCPAALLGLHEVIFCRGALLNPLKLVPFWEGGSREPQVIK